MIGSLRGSRKRAPVIGQDRAVEQQAATNDNIALDVKLQTTCESTLKGELSKKRLPAKKAALRELYLRSGNQCAFPDCTARLINSGGEFIAQLCHIEGVGATSARFNASRSDGELRAPSNLLFMCYRHHIETNDETAYTVERMREIKLVHEAKFSDIPGAILDSISDQTASTEVARAQSLSRMSASGKWALSPDEVAVSLIELNDFADRLSRIPRLTREFLAIAARRASRPPGINMSLCIGFHEIEAVTGLPGERLLGHFQILDKYGFCIEGFPDELGLPTMEFRNLKSGWPIWDDLVRTAQSHNFALEEIVVHLRFNRLD